MNYPSFCDRQQHFLHWSSPPLLIHLLVLQQVSVLVAIRSYRVAVHEEQVMLGNDVLLNCNIPSFEADFVSVASWVDSEGASYPISSHNSDGNGFNCRRMQITNIVRSLQGVATQVLPLAKLYIYNFLSFD